jgi:hypothetical protein
MTICSCCIDKLLCMILPCSSTAYVVSKSQLKLFLEVDLGSCEQCRGTVVVDRHGSTDTYLNAYAARSLIIVLGSFYVNPDTLLYNSLMHLILASILL